MSTKLWAEGLEDLFSFTGVKPTDIEQMLSDTEPVHYTKTDNRKAIGSLNDLVSIYKRHVWYDGGLDHCNLTKITLKLNLIPQRNLRWSHSFEAVFDLLQINILGDK